jgi:UTP-glucose-1-phosphate uridylyltransferase
MALLNTFEQKQELRKQLETKGQPSLLKSFDDIMNVNRFSNVNPELVDGFFS